MIRIKGFVIKFFFAWFDGWIGFYFDTNKQALYFCPLPFCVFKIARAERDDFANTILHG